MSIKNILWILKFVAKHRKSSNQSYKKIDITIYPSLNFVFMKQHFDTKSSLCRNQFRRDPIASIVLLSHCRYLNNINY